MTREELEALEVQIAAKREEREVLNQQAVQAKVMAKALSEEVRALEAKLPTLKQRAIVMRVEPASMVVRPKG